MKQRIGVGSSHIQGGWHPVVLELGLGSLYQWEGRAEEGQKR